MIARLAIAAAFIAALVTSAGAAQLVMLEQAGCPWCEAWDREVGGIYPKTDEGRRAPLRRVDIHAPLPEDLRFLRKEYFTPTFVLVDDGRELGRIRGYPGEELFWWQLDELMAELPEN